VSLNPDYTSRGYGFVCFESAESAQRAVDDNADGKSGLVVQRYHPTDRRDIRKAFNNIYVKNFPATWTDEELGNMFS